MMNVIVSCGSRRKTDVTDVKVQLVNPLLTGVKCWLLKPFHHLTLLYKQSSQTLLRVSASASPPNHFKNKLNFH